jgi:hypothetical protein
MFSISFWKIVPFVGNTKVKKDCRPAQATDDNMAHVFACWIIKATNIHSEYLLLIAFPWQQRFRKRAAMLRLYTHCLFFYTLAQYGNTGLRSAVIVTLKLVALAVSADLT